MEKLDILKNKKKTKILVRIIAHLMGDGCVTNKYFGYYNKNSTLLQNYERDVAALFDNIHFTKGKVNSGTSLIQVQNKGIILYLKSLVRDFRSFSLKIPEFVNTKELQKEFLRAFFDDEGCVGLRTFRKTGEIKRNLTLSSNSKKLLNQIKKILKKNFDINSNKLGKYVKIIGSKQYINYVLSITGKKNFEKFRKEIRITHPLKKEKLDLMIDSYIYPRKRKL